MIYVEEISENFGQKTQAPRGTRDFYGQQKRLRDGLLAKLKNVFELYGFEPLETPAFENYEVLAAKFAGGEEILKETYRFEDQGGRKLGLRYDLTVPLARFFACNPNLPKPFKRYALGSVWRDGPLKVGRYREFVQCDVDIVGASSVAADAEILALSCNALSSLGIGFLIKVNNRKLLDAVLEKAGVPRGKRLSAILSLDKLEKIGWQGVEKELAQKGACNAAQAAEIRWLFSFEPKTVVSGESDLLKLDGGSEIIELFFLAEKMGFKKFLRFSPSLARGLNYYTGNVFEAFLENGDKIGIASSIAAGGRYDEMLGEFLRQAGGREEKLPTVGISFGIDVLCEALARMDSEQAKASSTAKAFVIPIGEEKYAFEVVQALRAGGVPSSIDLMGRGISKNLEYASKQGIAFAVLVGGQEAKVDKVKVRNLKSGEEKLLPVSDAIELMSKG